MLFSKMVKQLAVNEKEENAMYLHCPSGKKQILEIIFKFFIYYTGVKSMSLKKEKEKKKKKEKCLITGWQPMIDPQTSTSLTGSTTKIIWIMMLNSVQKKMSL